MTCSIAATIVSVGVKVARDCNGFYRGFAESSVRIRFHLDDLDRLTKVAHFIPVKTTYSGPQLAELYMLRIVCLQWSAEVGCV
jgi:hypothetical protein